MHSGWWLENIKFVTIKNAEAHSEGQGVLLESRRSSRVEHQVLKSDTGLQHFKFCYNLVRVKDLTRAKQILALVAQRQGLLLSPLPIADRFLFHLEVANSNWVNIENLPPLVTSSVLQSWNYFKEGWLNSAKDFVGLSWFNAFAGVDIFSWDCFGLKLFDFLKEFRIKLLFFISHFLLLNLFLSFWWFWALSWGFRWAVLIDWFRWAMFILTFNQIFLLKFIFSLFSLLAALPEVMHDSHHFLQFLFFLHWTFRVFMIDWQGCHIFQDLFGSEDGIIIGEANLFAVFSINNSHQFAQKISLELSDAFEFSNVSIFAKIHVDFCEDPPYSRVKEVLDSVICAAWKVLGYLGPFISMLSLQLEKPDLFFIRPLIANDWGIKLMLPPK